MYFDAISFLFVLAGAIGFLVVKNNPEKHSENFGLGAAYFSCLGTLVGLVAIIGDRFLMRDEIKKVGSALAASKLAILYAYSIKLVTLVFMDD